MTMTYRQIGRLIVEDEQWWEERAEYGKETLKQLSLELTEEFGKWFSERNLKLMRQFYQSYAIGQTLSAESSADWISETVSRISPQQTPEFSLSRSHYVMLMRLDSKERLFYETESQKNNRSLRELKRQFDSSLYERIALSSDKDGVMQENLAKYHDPVSSADVVKDPYILEFLGLKEEHHYSESQLEQAIIDKIEHFLLELGKWFAFIWRQKRISFDERHFFVDLVFYNRLLQCFVIIDLKIWDITHQDIWQMQMYVNYYDRYVKTDDELPTIGIILCKDKDETLVEISLPENHNIYASKYQLYLPSKEELKEQLDAFSEDS